MRQRLRYGKTMDNDKVLCITDNSIAGDRAVSLLIDKSISFTKNRQWVPPYNREKYNGASHLWVISVNENAYNTARRALMELDPLYQRRVRIRRYS